MAPAVCCRLEWSALEAACAARERSSATHVRDTCRLSFSRRLTWSVRIRTTSRSSRCRLMLVKVSRLSTRLAPMCRLGSRPRNGISSARRALSSPLWAAATSMGTASERRRGRRGATKPDLSARKLRSFESQYQYTAGSSGRRRLGTRPQAFSSGRTLAGERELSAADWMSGMLTAPSSRKYSFSSLSRSTSRSSSERRLLSPMQP
mmetsp:Transcript_15405/g.43085  ORF Transcript_15405/g.43085 Transcript_15405/m.43085 type:complete len:206 (-) Transcript_15405:221-838(-)